MNTEIHANKKNIRLLIILVYLLVSTPVHFRFMDSHKGGTIPELVVKSIVFAIIILLELIEYFMDYPGDERKGLVRLFFLIRVLSVMASFIFGTIIGGEIEPFMFGFIPLLAFYSSFVMSLSLSILFTIGIAVLNIWLDVLHFQDEHVEFYFGGVLILQRVITIVIFYLFAYFWRTDIKKSNENELLLSRLNKSEENLRVYASGIAKASVLEERTRIARDMHDSVGHGLTAIQIQLRKAQVFAGVNIEESMQAVDAALEVAGSSLQDTRSVLHALREDEMNYSLENEIQPVIETLKQAELEVKFEVSGSDDDFNYAVLIALFRLVQEGATNILKHAKASIVQIILEFDVNAAKLTIEDDGQGFDTSADCQPGDTGMGIHGLKERFELIRGSLSVESEPGRGTRLTATTPKDPVKLIGEING